MSNVLIIDDDRPVAELLAKELVEAGHTVTVASTGLEGFRRYRDEPHDVVITDLSMPEQDGLDTIVGIKRDFPAARIIAIDDPGAALSLASALGATHTLEKPVNTKSLLPLINGLPEQV